MAQQKILKQNKNIRLVEFSNIRRTTIYEIQKRHWLYYWHWYALSFNGLNWFVDEKIATVCYEDAVSYGCR